MDQSQIITFLVERKFPSVRAIVGPGSPAAVTTSANRLHRLELVAAFTRELSAKEPDQLRQLYSMELENERQERVRISQEQERGRFFNLPSAEADFDYWCKAACWTLDEATALLLGKDPSVVTPASLAPFRQLSPFVLIFDRLRDLASRAVWAGALFDPVIPSVFANWAADSELHLPDPILKRVLGGQPARTVLERMINDQSKLINLLKETIELKDKRLSVAADRIAQAHGKNEGQAEAEELTPSKLSTLERDNMLKVIWGMAADAYGHRAAQKRSSTVKDIRNALQLQGFDLSDDTVRRYLTKAEERLPDWTDRSG